MYKSEQEVRDALEKTLRRSLPDKAWEWLVEDGYVRDVMDGCYDDAFPNLVKQAERYLSLASSSAKPEPNASPIQPRFMVWRSRAVSALLAMDAADREDVKKFREEVLCGRLLTAEEVPDWLEKQAEHDGKPKTAEVSIRIKIDANSEQDLITRIGKHSTVSELFTDSAYASAQVTGIESWLPKLDYSKPGDEFCYIRSINPEAVLGQLKDIAKKLSDNYRWKESQAVVFVLTDRAPAVNITMRCRRGHANSFEMNIPPWYSDEEVAHAYRQRRKLFPMLSKQSRSISDRIGRLVVFVRGNQDIDWNERCRRWNAQEAIPKDWHYKSGQAMNTAFARAKKSLLSGVLTGPMIAYITAPDTET